MAAEGTMFDWSGVYFKEVVKAPQSLVMVGLSIFMVMMATGRFAGDRVIARIGKKENIAVQRRPCFCRADDLCFIPLPVHCGFWIFDCWAGRILRYTYHIQRCGKIIKSSAGHGRRRIQYRLPGFFNGTAIDRIYSSNIQPAIFVCRSGVVRALRIRYGYKTGKS